jgi:hypothetical protein
MRSFDANSKAKWSCTCYLLHAAIFRDLLFNPEDTGVGWGTILQTGRPRVQFQMKPLDFTINLIFPAALWPWGGLSFLTELSTRNFPGGKGRPNNLTAIFPPIVQKMWELRRLTPLWASRSCYRDTFTFYLTYFPLKSQLTLDELHGFVCHKIELFTYLIH